MRRKTDAQTKKLGLYRIRSGAARPRLLASGVPAAATLALNLSASILGVVLGFALILLIGTALWRKFARVRAPEAEKVTPNVDGEDLNPYRGQPTPITESESPAVPPPLPGSGRVATWWCRSLDWGGLALITGIFSLFGLSQAYSTEEPALEKISPALLMTNIIISAFLVAMVLSLVAWRVRPVQWLGLRWKKWYWALLIGPSAVILMWLVLGVLQYSGYIAWLENLIGESSVQDAVKMLRESSDGLTVGLMAFSVVLVAPLAEEIIFRGYLYPVAKKFSNVGVGMLFSALVFAVGHGNAPLLLPLFLLGLILAAAYEWTGSLWASISVHLCFNAATVAIQMALRTGLLKIPEQMQ